jgi:hypothetical protein
MSVRERINTLYRRLRPAALVRDWYTVLRACDETRRRLDPEAELLDEATLRQMAREGAATGRDPGDVLAQLLIEQAESRAR